MRPGSDEIDETTRFVSPSERSGGPGSGSAPPHQAPGYERPAPTTAFAAQPPPYPRPEYPRPVYQQPTHQQQPPQQFAPQPYPPREFQAPARGGAPHPGYGYAPTPGQTSAVVAPRAGAGNVVGVVLLGLTLLAAFGLSVANIVTDGRVEEWWFQRLWESAVAPQWMLSLTVVVVAVGLLGSALASSRSWSRVPGVLVCWLLLLLSCYVIPIGKELGMLDDDHTVRDTARVGYGFTVMFAAAIWLVAKRRRVSAVWPALLGIPIGAGAIWIYEDQRDHQLRGAVDNEWAAEAFAVGGLWVLILAAALTVWLGVLADRLINPRPARATDFAPPPATWR